MDPFQLIMFISSIVLSVQFVPQNYKIYRNKSAKDISYITLTITLSGISGVIAYGVHMDLKEIWVPPIIQIVLSCQTLLMKIYYDKFYISEIEIDGNVIGEIDRHTDSNISIGIRNILAKSELDFD